MFSPWPPQSTATGELSSERYPEKIINMNGRRWRRRDDTSPHVAQAIFPHLAGYVYER